MIHLSGRRCRAGEPDLPGEVHGLLAFEGGQGRDDVRALAGPADLAVIATPARTVPDILRTAVRKGVRAAIVLSAGFREAGPAGIELERQLLDAIAGSHLRLLGPNCLGAMLPHLRLNATFSHPIARPGNIAFLSQSGALCSAILDRSLHLHLGLSALVSVGGMADVGWGDLLDHFLHDPNTRAVACYMESVGNAQSFLAAASRITPHKPVYLIKVGRSPAAAQAAASHTGALCGSDAVFDAALRRVGVLRVDSVAELFALIDLTSRQPAPRGPNLTIVTNAGGPGALATDALVTAGASPTQLSRETIERLNPLLPPHWSHANPVDILGDADVTRYRATMESVLKDPATDGLLVLLTPQAMTDATAIADEVTRLSPQPHVPILTCWMGGVAVANGIRHLVAHDVPAIEHPDLAAQAFALRWKAAQAMSNQPPTHAKPVAPHAVPPEARQLLQHVIDSGRSLLSELESKQLLESLGIPTVPTRFAASPDQAVEHAQLLGFPVAVKLHSHTVTHKSDVDGVQLHLTDAQAVRDAFHRIRLRLVGTPHFLGVTVQPMAAPDGVELILGSSTDPQFGPTILFGAGGRLVEVLHDHALDLPPLDPSQAQHLIRTPRIHAALGRFRGRTPVDPDALANIVVRFSEAIVALPRIASFEINPLVSNGPNLLALDARVLLHPPSIPDHQLPRPALLNALRDQHGPDPNHPSRM